MKAFMKLSAAALCALLSFAACDKENNPESNPGPDNPGGNVELTIPDLMFYGYYWGDYYGTGNGNVGISFLEGEVLEDEDYNLSGDGTIVFIDLNIPYSEDPDHVVVPAGVYELDANEQPQLGTWGAESYIIKVVNDEVVYEYAGFESGTVTVSKVESGYKYVLDLVIEDGEMFHMEYVGPAKIINSTEEGLGSNLSGDVNVSGLTQASMFLLGDLLGDGATETWAISIGDKYYDLLTDYGPGYSMLLYFNLEPGLSGVPAGTYTDFIDPLTAESLEPNTLLGGVAMYGMYMGCYYMCPALTEEAALKSGSVTVAVKNDIYTISGTLSDGYENKVSFSYEGEVVMMQYEEYSVKSASSDKGMIARKPSISRTRQISR